MEGEALFSRRGNNPGSGASQEGAGPDPSLGSSHDILGRRQGCLRGTRFGMSPLQSSAQEGRDSCFQPRGESPICSLSVGAGGAFPLWGHPGTAWRAMGHSGDREVTRRPSQHTQKSSSDHTHATCVHPSPSCPAGMQPRLFAAALHNSRQGSAFPRAALLHFDASLVSEGPGNRVSSWNRIDLPPPSIFLFLASHACYPR